MGVNLLSSTMFNVLSHYGGDEVAGTSTFCEMFDIFSDCLNVRSVNEHIKKRKPYLVPYTNIHDSSFNWLENDLLQYFINWEEIIENRSGKFTQNAKSKMLISWQIFESIQISVYSIIETVKFLISEGMEFVLTERFCQNPAEEYFGNQRGHGRHSDNPNFKDVGYNDNTIRIQKSISCKSGDM